jgi:hypothetical protein
VELSVREAVYAPFVKSELALISILLGVFSCAPSLTPLSAPATRRETFSLERREIRRGDCAFIAALDGEPRSRSVRCAQMLLDVEQAFRKSSMRQNCSEWPDMRTIADGGELEGLEFWPLSRGQFFMSVRCVTGAYNKAVLLFVWDENRVVPQGTAPPLLIFPAAEGPPEPIIGVRDFDPERSLLWAFEKALGDGSGGRYRRIGFEGAIPVLLEQATKTDADHRDGYNFSRELTPQGIGWKHDLRKKYGCLASLQHPACLVH